MLDTHILHRQRRHTPPLATTAEGCWIVDERGQRYLDASGGAAVSCLGHAHPRVLAAMHRQIDLLAYAHTSFFTSEPAEALAEDLITHAPPGLSHAYFVSGGSEAMEAALKLARQYFVEIGQPQRRHFIARRQSYHGNTLGALAIGGNAWRRAPYAPLLIETHHVSPCYAYRDQATGETDQAYVARLIAELEAEILRLGTDQVIAFVAETVVGATAGALEPVAGYFHAVRSLCDRHGILLILDEVMCGMGRTGSLHACEQEGVSPDLLTIAKGLGGGYQPIGAVLVSKSIIDALDRGSAAFQHGHTYIGHPVACAAALAVQQAIREEDLLARCRARGAQLKAGLQAVFREHPHVGDIRGRGLFLAIELVADRTSKRPFEPGVHLHARIKHEAFARGLLVYPMGGTADGTLGDHVLIAPPFIIEASETDLLIERLQHALAAALAGSKP